MPATAPFSVCTALIHVLKDHWTGSDRNRLKLLRALLENSEIAEVILLPGGFFSSYRKPGEYLEWVEEHVKPIVEDLAPNTTLVFGIDVKSGPNSNKHELAVALDKNGLKAVARKYHGSEDLILASSPWEKEAGYSRMFTKKGRKYYLTICYDIFGLRKKKVLNALNNDVILNTIHYFSNKGEENSGDTYFARHGLAGAARHWNCSVFGAAHFWNRPIPINWPSGIKWKRGLNENTNFWKYTDNSLKRSKKFIAEDLSFQLNYFRL